MTNGAPGVTGGERRVLLQGWGALALVVLGVMTVNGMTVQHDQPHLDWWEPWVWEGSSAVVVLALLWAPWLALRWAPPEGGVLTLRFLTVHLVALLAYSAAHVAGFLVLRRLAYALAGDLYSFGPLAREFPYEIRKDALAYMLFAATYWVFGRMQRPAQADAPATFDIRDGARIIRAPLSSILAVASAGNYVEFVLDDGRRPLMRTALSALESQLGDQGFVRTHRSWLVNAARVTGLRPAGSGDWAIQLGDVEAPLSRRFPEALERLRNG